ncbi:hypothetical protein FIBSPDRAFT_874339 [Athelia psychrophila]|uniref:Uncharacterized protein n=1 Tax=Athelia psychrophila TaxID=1759441 RepID=A0A165XLR3_9AGAM|nr:hypothetical protein FIBSPDRAFT_874339 [Fibularhizoctonia sp. CBS 109695]
MIILTRDENVNGSCIQSSDAATEMSEDTPESLEPPPPDYNNIGDTNHYASYAPDRKDGSSREVVLAPSLPNEFEAENVKMDMPGYQVPRSEHSGYKAGPPPDQYHQYDTPASAAKYEPPPGPSTRDQHQYAPPGPSSPPMMQGQYPAYNVSPPIGMAGPSSGGMANQRNQRMDKPPPSFSRPPPPGLPYNAFPSTYLIALRGDVARGFPPMPPPSPVAPHPFATHDVNEFDWNRFLQDLHRIGSIPQPQPFALMGRQGLISTIINAVRQAVAEDPSAKIRELVDLWNAHFFHPRRMEAILAAGPVRIDSGTGPVPALDQRIEELERGASGSMYGYDSDSDSDDPRAGTRRGDRQIRRELRREQKRARRDMKRARRAGSGGGSSSARLHGRYRLFIVGF